MSVLALSHLFYLMFTSGEVTAALAKIVDDFLLCGVEQAVNDVVQKTSQSFQLHFIVRKPGAVRYFWLNVVHYDDNSVTNDVYDKLIGANTANITRVWRR